MQKSLGVKQTNWRPLFPYAHPLPPAPDRLCDTVEHGAPMPGEADGDHEEGGGHPIRREAERGVADRGLHRRGGEQEDSSEKGRQPEHC